MRRWIALFGLAVLTGQVVVARDLDNRAYCTINDIIVVNRLKGPVADRVCNALRNEAERYDSFESVLIYAYEVRTLIKAAEPDADFLLLKLSVDHGPDGYWVHLANAGRRFKGQDGVLPRVRYQNLTADRHQWLADWGLAAWRCQDIMKEYSLLRDRGVGPSDAIERACTHGSDVVEPSAERLFGHFLTLGKWMLTGYDEQQAHRDLEAYVEARYVDGKHAATDTRGVQGVFEPEYFMSRKLVQAMRTDLAHMLVPVNHVVARAMDDKTPPAKQPPLGGFNLNGNWVEYRGTDKYVIVHEGYKVTIIREKLLGLSPAHDVVFEADLSGKWPCGDFKGRGKFFQTTAARNKYYHGPLWEWVNGGFEIRDKDWCAAQWYEGWRGSTCLQRVK